MKRFALIGAAGYVAPRHMRAIRDVGGTLVAALDPHDSVGVLDLFFPECAFFTEFERFDRHLSRNPVDYVSVCSPNYLHDAHCRAALRWGADAICEKPVVIRPRNVDELLREEDRHGGRIWCILQSRLHPNLQLSSANELDVVYHTPRGKWYDFSWKSDPEKSGGLIYNIGVHLFDLATLLLGRMHNILNITVCPRSISGQLEMDTGILNFDLSTEPDTSPRRYFGGMDLTVGFEDLHTLSYEEILLGNGFTIDDAREAIRICHEITLYTKEPGSIRELSLAPAVRSRPGLVSSRE